MMSKYKYPSKLLTGLLFLVCMNAYPQEKKQIKPATINDVYDYTETLYGKDDRLIRGTIFYDNKLVQKGHPNFLENKWFSGPIFIKGTKYTDIALKYNIERDKIIFLSRSSTSNSTLLVLDDNIVDSVYVLNRLIINSSLIPFELSGYYEPVYKGTFKAYIKHKNKFILTSAPLKNTSTSEPMLVGRYSKPMTILYLHINDRFIEVVNKKDLITCFELYKKEIQRFIKKHPINFQEIDNKPLRNLLKYCDEISSVQINEK